MPLPECCITCVFCHKKLYKDSTYSISLEPAIRYISVNDSKNALDGNFEFLNKEIIEYQNWEEEYKKKKKEYIVKLEQDETERREKGLLSPAYEIIKQDLKSDFHVDYDKLGVSKPLFGPIKDVYLSCYEEMWKDFTKEKIEEKLPLLETKQCELYYPIEKRGERTMEACRNERNFIMNNTTPTVNVNVNQNNTQTINSSANPNTNINMNIKDIFRTNLSEEDFLRIKEIIESSMQEEEKQNGIKEFIKDVGASTISKLLAALVTNFWL